MEIYTGRVTRLLFQFIALSSLRSDTSRLTSYNAPPVSGPFPRLPDVVRLPLSAYEGLLDNAWLESQLSLRAFPAPDVLPAPVVRSTQRWPRSLLLFWQRQSDEIASFHCTFILRAFQKNAETALFPVFAL